MLEIMGLTLIIKLCLIKRIGNICSLINYAREPVIYVIIFFLGLSALELKGLSPLIKIQLKVWAYFLQVHLGRGCRLFKLALIPSPFIGFDVFSF